MSDPKDLGLMGVIFALTYSVMNTNVTISRAEYVDGLLLIAGNERNIENGRQTDFEFTLLQLEYKDDVYLFAAGGYIAGPLDNTYLEMKRWLKGVRIVRNP